MYRKLFVSCVVACGGLMLGCGGDVEEGVATPGEVQQQQPEQPAAGTGAQATTPAGKAQELMDQLAEQTLQKNWTAAEQTLRQLESLRPSVPQDMQEQIDNARGSMQAAKQISEQGI